MNPTYTTTKLLKLFKLLDSSNMDVFLKNFRDLSDKVKLHFNFMVKTRTTK